MARKWKACGESSYRIGVSNPLLSMLEREAELHTGAANPNPNGFGSVRLAKNNFWPGARRTAPQLETFSHKRR